MLKRKVYQELLKWKENTEGKALCIIGARQIGKTTLIREFGRKMLQEVLKYFGKMLI